MADLSEKNEWGFYQSGLEVYLVIFHSIEILLG